jgi:cytidine deaminase
MKVPVQKTNSRRSARCPGPEHDLIVGLVGAVGTDLPGVEQVVAAHLSGLGFMVHTVSMSGLIEREFGGQLGARDSIPYEEYVEQRMTAGNVLRSRWETATAVAHLAIEEIRRWRDERSPAAPRACAFVIRSLKRAEEVRLLQEVYRGQFVLIGCHTHRTLRIRQLAEAIARGRNQGDFRPQMAAAQALAFRDEHEQGSVTSDPETREFFESYGQNVEATFPLADAYVNVGSPDTENEIVRFLDLLLGSPFITPSKDEVAMFHARAAALRSADLSRQVGASIATERGDIVAVGCNEVPRAGGGAYWEKDTEDARDFQRGIDGNQDQRDRAMREVFEVLSVRGLLSADARQAGASAFATSLADTRIDAIGEFSRATHAEMAALLDAARRGLSVRDATLYTSTFPCHNCAKHIVTAGIGRVVFIEPYPKSLAENLHGDAIVVDEPEPPEGKVGFEPFAGVAPVNYFALFAASGKRKDASGAPVEFTILPKLRSTFRVDPLQFEEQAIEELKELRERHGSPPAAALESAPRIADGDGR